MTPQLPPRRRWLPAAVALALAAPWLFTAVGEDDTGWHIALGRLVQRGQVPRTNALSWAFGATPWYDTSWLYDWLLATVTGQTALGPQLVTLSLLAITLGLLAVACAREGSAWIVPAIALLLVPRTTPRPHVAAWAVLAAALAARSRRERALAVLAVALGSNFHTGAAFGAAVLGLLCLEAFARERDLRDLGLAALAGLALLANPGFAELPRVLLQHLTIGDVVQLREFEPPSLRTEPAFFALLAAGAVIAVVRAREKPALLVATLVFGALGLRTGRMVYEAQLVLAPSLAWGLCRLPLRGPGARAAAVASLAVLAAASHRLDPRGLVLSTAWEPQRLPVRAARFLAQERLAGPHYNGLRDGGYLEYALPDLPAFIDGRELAAPREAMLALQEAEKSRAQFQAHLRGLGCEWAVATRLRERLGGFRLLEGPEWALVYWDELSEVWVRRDVARLADLRERLEYRYFRPYGPIVAAVAKLPAAELVRLDAEVARFETTAPGEPFAALVRCASASQQGRADAGALCDRALLNAPAPVAALVAKARALRPR